MGAVIKAHVHLGVLSFFSSGGTTEQLHQAFFLRFFFHSYGQDVRADAVMAARFI